LELPSAEDVLLLEKEEQVAFHASGRNSGVLHSGFYYRGDSFKARFCIEGNRRLREYCRERDLPLNECGKLVVPTTELELSELHKLYKRGRENGSTIELITAADAQALQPGVKCVREALFAPLTSTVSPTHVVASLLDDFRSAGGRILTGTRYRTTDRHTNTSFAGAHEIHWRHRFVNAAGLYSDVIAREFGHGDSLRVLPFAGSYLTFKSTQPTVKRLIYPVPDPLFPFLGVHYTVTAGGLVKVGPTAMPALWREQYGALSRFRGDEFVEVVRRNASLLLGDPLFRRHARSEIAKLSPSHIMRAASRLLDVTGVPKRGQRGIRAQLFDLRTGTLSDDFLVEADESSVHVLNAVSPAFTCSLPFADYLIERYVLPQATYAACI
jgi:(S)-2-hydroxyglutarate dehydrogenase